MRQARALSALASSSVIVYRGWVGSEETTHYSQNSTIYLNEVREAEL